MGLRLPLDATEDAYSISVELEGVEVVIRAYWLERASGWYLDMATPDGVELAAGVRIAPGSVLPFPGAGPGVPPGRLVSVGPDSYGYSDLGPQVGVIYLTAAEVVALREAAREVSDG